MSGALQGARALNCGVQNILKLHRGWAMRNALVEVCELFRTAWNFLRAHKAGYTSVS